MDGVASPSALLAPDPPSQSDIAYGKLRQLITSGECRPGILISEQTLADQIGVGRSPIREAISRLIHERMMIRFPRRGVMVRALTLDEVREIYEVRECLEVLAVQAAVKHLDDDAIAALRGLLDTAQSQVDAGGAWSAYLPFDRAFHERIWKAMQNSRATQILSELADAAVLEQTQHQSPDWADQAGLSIREHTAILDAIANRDLSMATERMSHHARDFQRRLIARIGQSGRMVGASVAQ